MGLVPLVFSARPYSEQSKLVESRAESSLLPDTSAQSIERCMAKLQTIRGVNGLPFPPEPGVGFAEFAFSPKSKTKTKILFLACSSLRLCWYASPFQLATQAWRKLSKAQQIC